MNQTTQFREVAQIFQAALKAVDPQTAVFRSLSQTNTYLQIGSQQIPLEDNTRLFLVSVGKASNSMARAAISVLGKRIVQGIIISKEGGGKTAVRSPNITHYQAGHPIANEASFSAARAVKKMLTQTTPHDIVLCLLSGGASALLSKPRLPHKLWQHLNELLLRSGCTIQAFNTVRRQLDEVKGGGVASWAMPAACHTLIISDVIGNDLAAIGSGPTYYDATPPTDALAILHQFDIPNRLGEEKWQQVKTAVLNPPLTPKNSHLSHHIIGDVRLAAQASQSAAQKLGYKTQILTTSIEGEARELGKFVAAIGIDSAPGCCTILGGEPTVTVRGGGMGGRNSELALAAALALDGRPHITIASLATDGDDGMTGKAGVMVDGQTVQSGRLHHLDPLTFLKNNDSGTYFNQLEAATGQQHQLNPGQTGTNVNDLIYIFRHEET